MSGRNTKKMPVCRYFEKYLLKSLDIWLTHVLLAFSLHLYQYHAVTYYKSNKREYFSPSSVMNYVVIIDSQKRNKQKTIVSLSFSEQGRLIWSPIGLLSPNLVCCSNGVIVHLKNPITQVRIPHVAVRSH